jgi:hypothetical protein
MESIATIPEKIAGAIGKLGKMFENLGTAAVNASKVLVIKAAATAILEVVGSLIIISQIPADDIYRATSVLVVIAGVFAVLMKVLRKTTGPGLNIKASLISLTAFSANLIAIASVIAAAGGAVFLVVKAFTIINESVAKYGEEGFKQFGIMMGILVATLALFVVMGAALKKEYLKTESVLSTFIGMATMMTAFGSSVLMIAGAMSILSMIPVEKFSDVQITLGLIAGIMAALVFVSSLSTPKQMLAASVAMIGISVALSAMAVAIKLVALLPMNDDVLNAVETFVGLAIVMFASVGIISKIMTSSLAKVGTLIIGILGIQLVMITLVGAIAAITAVAAANPEAFKQATEAMTQILMVLSVAILQIKRIVTPKIFIERYAQQRIADNDTLVERRDLCVDTRHAQRRKHFVERRKSGVQFGIYIVHTGVDPLDVGQKALQGRVLKKIVEFRLHLRFTRRA